MVLLAQWSDSLLYFICLANPDRHVYLAENIDSCQGELAQMVERSICIREAPGSMPGFSILTFVVSGYLTIF